MKSNQVAFSTGEVTGEGREGDERNCTTTAVTLSELPSFRASSHRSSATSLALRPVLKAALGKRGRRESVVTKEERGMSVESSAEGGSEEKERHSASQT